MSYEEFIRKIKYISNIKIYTDDVDLQKALDKVIKKEIENACNLYYNE